MRRLTLPLVCFVLLGATLLLPQRPPTLAGRVITEYGGGGLGGVEVRLYDSAFIAVAVTDENGHFSLTAPARGTYTLHLRRMGYRDLSSQQMELGPGDALHVQLRMSMEALSIEPLHVSGSEEATARQ